MTLFVPSTEAAGGQPQQTWVCPEQSESGAPAVILNYARFEVVMEQDEMSIPASREFSQLASESPQEHASVETVLGVPALEVAETTDSAGVVHPGVVELRAGGDRVLVRGDADLASLVAIAQSLSPASAAVAK
jgi:hypothetical protein